MTIAIIVAVILMLDFAFAWVLISSCVAPIKELAKQFPAVEPEAGAVRRGFQSFRLGLLKAGWGIHVAVDSKHLHLYPALMERWFRIPPLSVPWTHLRLVKRGKRNTKVRIEGDRERMEITGPTWCLELATGTP